MRRMRPKAASHPGSQSWSMHGTPISPRPPPGMKATSGSPCPISRRTSFGLGGITKTERARGSCCGSSRNVRPRFIRHAPLSLAADPSLTLRAAGARRLNRAFPFPQMRIVVKADSVPFNREGRNAFAQFVEKWGRDAAAGRGVARRGPARMSSSPAGRCTSRPRSWASPRRGSPCARAWARRSSCLNRP